MSDKRLEITISGDPSGLKKATAEAAAAIDQLQKSGERLAQGTKSQMAAADAYIERLKQESIQLAGGELALRKYQLSKLNLADATLKQSTALAESIDKMKQHERAARDAGAGQQSMTAAVFGGVTAADLAVKAFEMLVKTYGDMKAATLAMQQIELRQEAVLRATGQAASGKREIIEELSRSMAKLTKFDDDQVKSAAQQVLTLGLSNEHFERAIKLGGDLAVTYGMDLTQASMLLGKALVSPGEGLGRLEGKLGKFSDALKRQIKALVEMNESGRAADLILAETSRVAGVAEGAYAGLERKTSGVSKAWDDLFKAMGSKIFDAKSTEASALENALRNTTSFIEEKTPVWEKALRVLGALSNPASMAIGAAKMTSKPSEAASSRGPTLGELFAQDDAAEKAERSALETKAKGALGLLGEMRDRFASDNDKLDKEIARFKKLVKDTGMAESEFADIEKNIRAKYATKGGADGSLSMLENARKALAVANAEAANGTDRLTAAERKLLEIENSDAFKKASPRVQQLTRDLYEQAAATERATLAEKALAAEHERDLKATEQLGEMRANLANSWAEETDRLRDQVDQLGMTNLEREKAALLIKKNSDLIAAGNDAATIRDINAAYQEQVALLEQRDAKTRELQWWDQFSEQAGRAINNVSGWLRDLGRELAALATKKVILQIGASLTGSSALQSAAANAGGNSLAGSILGNAAGSLFSGGSLLAGNGILNALGTGASSIGMTSIGNFLGGATGALQGPTLSGAALGGNAAAAGAEMSSMLSAAGPYIALALAAYGIYKMLAGKRGGAKQGGSYQGIFDASGALTGTIGTHLYGLKPEESIGNPETQRLTTDAASAVYEMIRRLGGSAQGLTFGLGYDQDPRGTAQSRVTGRITGANGQTIFDQSRDIGRDDARLGPELQLTTSRMVAAALKASELPDYLKKVFDGVVIESASQEQIDALIKRLSDTKAAFDALTGGLTQAGDIMALLNGNAVPQLKTQLNALRMAVDAAQGGFDAALAKGDPTSIQAAQASLLEAVMNRYTTEKQMIAEIQAGLSSLKADAYAFKIANAERINRLGGNVNIGSIASGYMGDLAANFGTGTPEEQMANVNAYLSALDQWVAAETAQIQSNATAGATIAQLQAAAAQTQISALQEQLQLAQQWAGVLDSAQQALDAMQRGTSNPLHALGRLGTVNEDIDGLLGQYRGATGSTRIGLANRLMQAVNARSGLNAEANQRPSDAFLQIYNENVAILSEIKADAQTEAEKQTTLQQRITALQEQANAYAASTAQYTGQTSASIDALHAQARALAEQAGDIYIKAATKQEAILTDQLNAITGGMDVALYQAQQGNEIIALLDSINTQITAFMTGNSSPVTGNTGPTGTGVVPAGGGGAGGGGGGGGGDIRIVVDQPVVLDGREIGRNAFQYTINNKGTLKRELETS